MAAMLTIFLLSLIGVPLTGGFFGKFYIFKAALDSNLFWLTILGLLNSAIAAYYYLRHPGCYVHEGAGGVHGQFAVRQSAAADRDFWFRHHDSGSGDYSGLGPGCCYARF